MSDNNIYCLGVIEDTDFSHPDFPQSYALMVESVNEGVILSQLSSGTGNVIDTFIMSHGEAEQLMFALATHAHASMYPEFAEKLADVSDKFIDGVLSRERAMESLQLITLLATV